ncbi:MAG: CPBP family intramembrane metalloprotease [Acidobacteria bacterium]|nr:MAG: CPBP family intramembrane metalloprotease [Acidobacteriota bacterium]
MVRTLDFLTPHGLREFIFFTAVAITAGFCEELIFRGYLQKQFHAASGNALVGIIAQALLFGAGHGYQGVKSMLVIGVFGALFGALAFWRRSLRPGMIAHAWQDFLAGLLLGAYAGTR